MSRRRSSADDRLAQRALAALRITAAEEARAGKPAAPVKAETAKTTFRIGARVTVTYNTREDIFTGTVTDAWPAGSNMTYRVLLDDFTGHPGVIATADELSAADDVEDGA